MQRNLLIEIGSEEIPAGFVKDALKFLSAEGGRLLSEQRIGFQGIQTMGTPRRLMVFVEGVDARQEDLTEKVMGPPKKVAFDPEGLPTKAAEGFAKKNNCHVEDLVIEETDRGPYVCINKVIKGGPTEEVLKTLIPQLIASIPFPKTMKWERSGFRFARPIRWLVVLFGDHVVDVEVAGVKAGNESFGHRFHVKAPVMLEEADLSLYTKAMEDAYVIVDQDKRREIIRAQAEEAVKGFGARLLEDEELLALNTFLVEYPFCIGGSFDEKFLALPREVLITCMKEHQKYFAVVDEEGRLSPHFVAVNNIVPKDRGLLRRGHERVLRARLNDAAFFFQEDSKRPMEAYVEELSGMTFHKELGSLLDKVRRIEDLGAFIAGKCCPDKVEIVRRAAYLSKADLVTEMVGEFPNLQGIMGREYALISGESKEVAQAIYEHYLPVRSGGELPESLAGAVLSISDKMDTICSTFALGLRPTGGQDPFGLRRLALGIIHIMEDKATLFPPLSSMVAKAISLILDSTQLDFSGDQVQGEVLAFFRARLKHHLVSKGLRPDTVEAALCVSFDDPRDAAERARAIESVRSEAAFDPLSTAFKRVMNILKGIECGEPREELLVEPGEKALYEDFQKIGAQVLPLIEKGAYKEAMQTLLGLKPSIDRFFDEVLVMTEDEDMRNNRLGLLMAISRLFLRIGDLSQISA